jgi:hypothetical protein
VRAHNRDVRSRRQVVLGLLALVASAACRTRSADPVAELLSRLEVAAEARDAVGVVACLSEQYRGGHGLDRSETAQQVRRWFAGYENVSLEVYGVEVERSAGLARVRCVVEFAGRGRSACRRRRRTASPWTSPTRTARGACVVRPTSLSRLPGLAPASVEGLARDGPPSPGESAVVDLSRFRIR